MYIITKNLDSEIDYKDRGGTGNGADLGQTVP